MLKPWLPLIEHTRELSVGDIPAFARAQCGPILRRAGITTQFTLATALEGWRCLEVEPEAPTLAMLWHNPTLAGPEIQECLAELFGALELPMPFQFLNSQPTLIGPAAAQTLPGLVHLACLPHATRDPADLLPSLAHRRPWTHALLGNLHTPMAPQENATPFRARWTLYERPRL
ncbi:MAG: hypothetical protein LWX11_08615 [Firmicutes bacterium]|nr:hypothetical protein [Bacillota bacterium]